VIDQGVLNSKSAIDVRDFILSHFSILAIIDLPDSTFMPYANVSSSILLLRKVLDKAQSNHVFFAKSENVGRKSNGDEDYSYLPDGTAVQNNDLPKILEIWKDYVHGKPLLDVSFGCYSRDITSTLKEDDSHRLDYAFHHPFRSVSKELINESKYKLCTLSDLCEERNESYLTSSDPGTTSILFTGLADIESFTGIAHQVQTPSGSVKSAVKHYLPGDVVVSKMRPNLRKIAFMDFKQDGYVSSECSVFTIKRNKDGSPLLDPKLLSAILRSDYVFGQMMPYISGIGRPRISGSDLRKIKLPIPPKSIQDSALVSLNKSLSIAQELAKNAAELEEKAKQEELRGRNEVAKILSGAQNND
jgi:type I restriction-modification system DNA methylase subunit